MEFAFLPNSKNDYGEKRYNYSLKKKIPLILLLNLFGNFIITQFLKFVNIVDKIFKITFRNVTKSLLRREKAKKAFILPLQISFQKSTV